MSIPEQTGNGGFLDDGQRIRKEALNLAIRATTTRDSAERVVQFAEIFHGYLTTGMVPAQPEGDGQALLVGAEG